MLGVQQLLLLLLDLQRTGGVQHLMMRLCLPENSQGTNVGC